eukprot:gene21776-41920_t
MRCTNCARRHRNATRRRDYGDTHRRGRSQGRVEGAGVELGVQGPMSIVDRVVSVPMRGVVSILFTDIVGSTRLWSAHEAAMAVALARHDELLLATIATHDGEAFKHTGDGMAAVFADPERAVAAAIAVQRTIESEQWGIPGGIHVRAAVHSGGVHERDGDLFGPTLNR